MGILATSEVTPETTPEKWIVFLHGILGSGANWRSFARQIVTDRPAWGALLVDLRLHGDSVGMEPPHTLESAARDVVSTLSERGMRASAVLGHSFGGKVGLEVSRQLALSESGPLDHLFVIDSTPGARPDYRGSSGVRNIVELLAELPDEFPDRNAFTAWITERGVDRPTAMWLAMNVRPLPNTTRFVFRIDVPAARAMMEDYFHRDLWPVLESPPSPTTRVHLIAGERSQVLDADDLNRARRIQSGVSADVVAGAGHWVHVDAPEALRRIVVGYLDR